MNTRLTKHSHIQILLVFMVLALFSILSPSAHAQAIHRTTLTVKPGAALVLGHPVNASSLFTLQPANFPLEEGALWCIGDLPSNVIVTGLPPQSVGPNPSINTCTLLFGHISGSPDNVYNNFPWTNVTFTATTTDNVEFEGGPLDIRLDSDSGDTIFFNLAVCTAPCISLDLVDAAFGFGFGVGGVTSASSSALAWAGQSRIGVAADGVARLLVRATTTSAGQVTFSIPAGPQGAGDQGFLTDPKGTAINNVNVPTIAVGGKYEAFAVYQAPLDYAVSASDNSSSRTVTLSAVFTPSAGGQVSLTQDIVVVRPPVVLVHGLWSSYVDAWETVVPGNTTSFKAGLLSAIAGLNIQAADYTPTNAASFTVNYTTPGNAIASALFTLHSAGYAAAQADVIGHSMGGLLSRIWTEETTSYSAKFYRTDQNYFNGNVHKLITINSPHLGAFRADELLPFTTTDSLLAQAMLKAKKSITGGAVRDLATHSPAISNLNAAASGAPASVIAGNNGNDSCIKAALTILDWFGDPLGASTMPNDAIVDVSSQAPGSPSLPEVPFVTFPYCHTNITSSSVAVAQAVILLNSSASDITSFRPFPPNIVVARSSNVIAPRKIPAVAQTSSFAIISPVSGTIVAPGDQVSVVTQASNGFTPVSILIVTSDTAVSIASPSTSVPITIPATAAGPLTIMAVGQDSGGSFQSAQVTVQVAPSATLNSIAVTPSFIQLSSQETAQLAVIGYYSDNVARDITGLATTTYQLSQFSSATVATVDQNGVVTGVGPGTTYVLVSNSSQSTAVQIDSEGTGAGAPNTHDLNGDGKSDIIWTDGNGDVAFWLMNGATLFSSGSIGGIPSAWSIVGQRDFDGDGMTDLLWRDTSGNTAIWFMNGATILSAVSVGAIPTSWSVVGTGDFNGDGLGDILWRDSSGNLAVWLMNGATISSGAGLGNVLTNWNVVGTGDFDGDGKTDLLWQDNLGNTSIWFMNGTTIGSTGGLGNIPANWSVVGTGDFNSDGKADIVWRDAVGDTSIWLMQGATVWWSGGLGNIPTTWSIALLGDFDGDGASDLLWRDSLGNTAIWFMTGTALVPGTSIASTAGLGNVPTNWTVQSANAE